MSFGIFLVFSSAVVTQPFVFQLLVDILSFLLSLNHALDHYLLLVVIS